MIAARARHGVAAFALIPFLLAPVVLAPRPARAGELGNLTSTTTGGWRTDAGYGSLFEKMNLSTDEGGWRLALRIDAATFFWAPVPEVRDRYTLEKVSAGYAWRDVELSAGDAYVSFGRGLGLSLRKVDELGIDTTVRGAKLLVHKGDLDLVLVAGYTNINNTDEATGTSADDPYDLIGGFQGRVRIADRLTLGAYATGVAFREPLGIALSGPFRDRILQLGATVDAPRLLEPLGIYLEGIVQAVLTEPAAEHVVAYGLYATTTASLGPATLLFEGKLYGPLTPLNPNLENPAFGAVAYNNPPTAERVLQILENPQRDVAGGRLRLDWRFSPAFVAYASYGLFWDWQGYSDPDAVGEVRSGAIHDPYAGVELRWNGARSWAIASGGWRAVVLAGSGALVRGDGHVELDVAQSLGEHWSLTLHALHLERKKHSSPILDEEFREGTIEAGFRFRPWLSVSAGYDYTTEPTQPKRDYFHGNVAVDITPSSRVELFVGSARGGLKCVSGVCRVFPPFEGVKVTATLRY